MDEWSTTFLNWSFKPVCRLAMLWVWGFGANTNTRLLSFFIHALSILRRVASTAKLLLF
jgi:hypothetical protein